MPKERFLTVLVPIKDSDAESTVYASESALQSAVPASASNVNKIYKIEDGTYRRSTKNGNSYSYATVVEREFPYLGSPMELYDFTYDATRMGPAPTITANGYMRFAENDSNGQDITLEDLWCQECHVIFNGEKFYIKGIPTSSKSNEDARYKYDIEFVAERAVLDNVYIYDIVSPFITEKPLSQSSTFSFFGDVRALADRINASLIRSGLASVARKYVGYPNHPNVIVQYLTYEQWNRIPIDSVNVFVEEGIFDNFAQGVEFTETIYYPMDANYNRYLNTYIYENQDGEYLLNGYQCKIGKDKKGEDTVSEEKLVTFDDNTIHEALQQFHDTFDTDYYVVVEKDANGAPTGNTFIMVEDCEHDFADWDDQSEDYIRDDDGIPTTENPFDYGVADELLSKEKSNTTDKIVTRITGVGSSENIPWYYPNPSPDGWIKPVYKKKGVEQSNVDIDYPTSEGTTVEDNVRFEKFIKNRIGTSIKFGVLKELYTNSEESVNLIPEIEGRVYQTFDFNTDDIAIPEITLDLGLNMYESGCTRLVVDLYDKTVGSTTYTYDSSVTYPSPNAFQVMCAHRDGRYSCPVVGWHSYRMTITYYVPDFPTSRTFSYDGYRYPSQTITVSQEGLLPSHAYIGENFYGDSGLSTYVSWHSIGTTIYIDDAGYSSDGTASTKEFPMPRIEGKKYFDWNGDTVYLCTTSESVDPRINAHLNAFQANPDMGNGEWKRTFVDLKLGIYEASNWYIGSEMIYLSDYGLGEPEISGESFKHDLFDTIEFKRAKYLTTHQNLMPEVFIRTDGERRFYNAHNYWDSENGTLYVGTADTAIGEVQSGDKVKNPIYKENETDSDSKHYMFETEYNQKLPHEHIEDFDDIKATIKEQTVTIDGQVLRIDVMEMFGYDVTDNDEIWESSDDGGTQGEYKHPYFFAKLRPLGFNIFDLALQEDMVVSMTTGDCGACNFKIGVDEKTKKNPVQVWEYDVYGGSTYDTKGDKLYSQGDLRRYVNLTNLHYDTNGQQSGYKPIVENGGGMVPNSQSSVNMYYSYTYSDVEEGYVGTVKKNSNVHFEGDVVTGGRFMESQQDTSEGYVWVALQKDTETYGTIMPSAKPNYEDPSFNVYIRPKSISDVHVTQDLQNNVSESTNEEDEELADKFVILNIKLPQIYLRRAERKLSRELVKYMYENNYQKFNFSVKFSRIFLEENEDTRDSLNENSVIYILFNRRTYRQYVKHYTYKMSSNEPLPEINVETNDDLPVTMAFLRQQEIIRQRANMSISSSLYNMSNMIHESSNETINQITNQITTTNITNICSVEWGEI